MSEPWAKLDGVDAGVAVLQSTLETKEFRSEATLARLKAGKNISDASW